MNPPAPDTGPTPALAGITVIPRSELESGNFSVELQGKDCGMPGISLILVEAPPGRGPSLHKHDYAEIIVVQEGSGTFSDGARSLEVSAGSIVIVAAGQPHAFTNTGDGPLKQIDVHVADAFATDWL
jgi:mannose-6-phosphate isomerase-like protein (cupin superfamily)